MHFFKVMWRPRIFQNWTRVNIPGMALWLVVPFSQSPKGIFKETAPTLPLSVKTSSLILCFCISTLGPLSKWEHNRAVRRTANGINWDSFMNKNPEYFLNKTYDLIVHIYKIMFMFLKKKRRNSQKTSRENFSLTREGLITAKKTNLGLFYKIICFKIALL